MEPPRLETERLILRALAPSDRDAVFANYSDPDVAKWFFDQPYMKIEEADQIINRFVKRSSASASIPLETILTVIHCREQTGCGLE